ncbi:MAG TPA: hypothetical protein VGN29_18795 [Solirubrobacteraceae bacterium]|jgi:hypothetical protein|nr:hypothetical protein [Solirubrobacteraceae bacterium]
MPEPNLDRWLSEPSLRVAHRRESTADVDRLWAAAQRIRVADAGLLGRLVRWRIPGVPPEMSFDQMFRSQPFIVLDEDDGDGDGRSLVSGLVGRIWTLRRDYPKLREPHEYRSWEESGTAKVLFANWVEPLPGDRSAICMEARVRGIGARGRVGVAAVRPLVSRFQQLVGTEGMQAAVRLAEGE